MDSLGKGTALVAGIHEQSRNIGRILHITTRHVLGGGSRNLNFTLEWELRSGYEVHMVVGDAHPARIPEGVQLHELPALRRALAPGADLTAYRQLRRLIRSRGFDMVSTHQSKAGIVGRLAARGRVRVLAHTIHMASFGPGYPIPYSMAFKALERRCGGFTDLLVPVGEDLRRRYLRAGIGTAGQYHVVRSPIDVRRFAEVRIMTDRERMLCRARLGLPPGRPIIAAAGLLEPRKRIGLMIRKLAPVLRANSNLVLAIAGTGPQAQKLSSLRSELGLEKSVHFLGWLGDVRDLLAVASLLVQTSAAEGVSQVVIQALAAGVPIVGTDVEGLREVPHASITVLNRNGKGLALACARILERPITSAVTMDRLLPWTEERVAEELARLHEQASQVAAAAAAQTLHV